MLYPGLVSVTFRELSLEKIVDLVAQAELTGIEWGGDVRVPHGDQGQARAVRRMTVETGLTVAAYGSYYRAGHPETGPFEAILETAIELDAPSVRVWAGKRGSADADAAYRARVKEWQRYLRKVASTGRDHYVVLEFVKDASPASFLRDAVVLARMLAVHARF
jgi:3-dehydroshikimate dehydratase